MGQTLSEPVTEKHTTVVVRQKKFWVGLSDMQGWRISMEDSHSVHLYLPPTDVASSPVQPEGGINDIPIQPAGSTVTNDSPSADGNALIGVFDGHGGSSVAKFTGTTLHTRLAGLDSYKNGDYEAALKEAYMKTDQDLRADPNFFNDPSGCTAVVSLVTQDGRIICANAGDSRGVLGYKGDAKELSSDHKPTNAGETARITSAGGFVEFGRVNGNLALSRAIGDFEFKQNFSLPSEKQIVTCDPDITTHRIDGEEEFMVLACDGIWDCLTSQQVIDFIRRAVANGDGLGKICENLMTKCLATSSETAGLGCDNMTVVIVALLNGRTEEEWQAWVKERVDKKVGRDTPESIPDVFGPARPAPMGGGGGFGGGAGFRVAGSGGLANLASILGASGFTFKQADDSDDEDDELHIIGNDELQAASEETSGPTEKLRTPDHEKADGYLDDKALKGQTAPRDVTSELDSEEILQSSAKRASIRLVDDDGDSQMESDDESDTTTTGVASPSSQSKSQPAQPTTIPNPATPEQTNESPIPPSFTSIGSPEVPTHLELQALPGKKGAAGKVEQLKSTPGGDAYSAAAKIEGMMDTSESPLRL